MGREDFAVGTDGRHRQPYLGRGLFAGGIVALLVAAVLAASASVAGAVGLGTAGARELAGVFAGVGLAAALVGALAVVPADRSTWVRGLAGAFVAVCGVGAFLFAYPGRWYGDGADLTLSVVAVYALGVVTTASYLFAAVADLTGRIGRAEALAAAVPGVEESAGTAGTGADETDGSTEADPTDPAGPTADATTGPTKAGSDRSGGEVLYERTSESATAGEGLAGGPTIDRIEPAEGAFDWPDSGFSVEPTDRVDSAGGPSADVDADIDASADADPWDAPRRERASTSISNPDGSSGRGRARTPVAVATNGAGTITASVANGRSPTAGVRSSADGTDGSTAPTTESADGGPMDIEPPGTGPMDGGPTGAGPADVEPAEAESVDARSFDARSTDMGSTDTGSVGGGSANGRSAVGGPATAREAGTDAPTDSPRSPTDGGVDAIRFGPSVDRYCGNCTHFRYVRTEDGGLSPYCGYHDEVMDDMESCLEWTSNA